MVKLMPNTTSSGSFDQLQQAHSVLILKTKINIAKCILITIILHKNLIILLKYGIFVNCKSYVFGLSDIVYGLSQCGLCRL